MPIKTSRAAVIPLKWLAAALLLLHMTKSEAQTDNTPCFSAAWWNVENLFDTYDDPKTNDDEFTPQGEQHWTRRKLNAKLQGIAKTIAMMGCPDVVGLAEVENRYVLNLLCQNTSLVRSSYRYIHFDSPDKRGIDCALLYRADRFHIDKRRTIGVSDRTNGFFTRDILEILGHTVNGDTLCLLLCHWPSKRGGEKADLERIRIADTVRQEMIRQRQKHPQAAIIAMGDLNSDINDHAIALGMRFGFDSISADGIRILTPLLPKTWGSYKYQGIWEYIDHIFLHCDTAIWQVMKMQLIRFDHLLTEEKRRPGVRPRRTNQGLHYEGGLSDHLPLLLHLRCSK